MRKLVFGVGINDADYVISPTVKGKLHVCHFYRKWLSMLERCYCEKYKSNKPTYTNCSVCEEWLKFSNFKEWMEQQDWKGKHLDKDLLIAGNKVYSPNTCTFIDRAINTFITEKESTKGDCPTGVSFHSRVGKFQSYCRNPFTKNLESLGYFDNQHQAHLTWKNRKHELACQLAELQSDPRAAEALRVRYLATPPTR